MNIGWSIVFWSQETRQRWKLHFAYFIVDCSAVSLDLDRLGH